MKTFQKNEKSFLISIIQKRIPILFIEIENRFFFFRFFFMIFVFLLLLSKVRRNNRCYFER